MIQGTTIRIKPSWVNAEMRIDIAWDTVLLGQSPHGDWWGSLALLGRTGLQKGEWDWDQAQRQLILWVPVPNSVPGHRRLLATLFQADMPLVKGAKGNGELQPGVVPTTQPPPFDWFVDY